MHVCICKHYAQNAHIFLARCKTMGYPYYIEVTMNCSINDIARHLNLSRNTISKALNGKPGVSPETRRLILETASEMRYRNVLDYPGNDERQSKGTILFLTKATRHTSFWLCVMEGIKRQLENTGYKLALSIMSEEELRNKELPNLSLTEDVKGIIIVEICNLDMCRKILGLGLPTVTVDMPRNPEAILDNIDVVTMENKRHISNLVDMLVKQGKRRFSFAGDLFSDNVSQGFIDRYASFTEALKRNGLSEDKDSSFTTDGQDQFLNLPYLIDRIKKMERLPEVYFCGNDWTALQLMHALTYSGYSVPDDVYIVGFDNTTESSESIPALTTINTPKEQLGKTTIDCIVGKIESPERASMFIQVATNLIIRDSTGDLKETNH